ncbi:MAG: hypothetical protein HY317_01580 [Acidobacteria bacterium]|nr:hypothetical protein [Acidobacteriota bacterium]
MLTTLKTLLCTTLIAAAGAGPQGTWKGTTSQDRPIELRLREGSLSFLKVGWRLTFDKPCPPPGSRIPAASRSDTHVMRFQAPVPLEDGALRTRVGIGRDLDLVLEGTFDADGAASGEILLETIESSPCRGRTTLKWKAHRK